MIMSTTFYPLLAKCLATGAAALQLASCSSVSEPSLAKAPVAKVTGEPQHGVASIYTDHRTASGERFSSSGLTAAHRSLPLGSQVKVTHLGTNKSVIVRINDRGPYIRGRIIDLTPAAAARIGLGSSQGIAKVKVERVETPEG
jgi:rare lipoprotein A